MVVTDANGISEKLRVVDMPSRLCAVSDREKNVLLPSGLNIVTESSKNFGKG